MLNVFRKIDDDAVVCLVRDGAALPRFMRGRWAFDGKAAEPLANHSDFDREAAEAALRIGGFYVFAAEPETSFGVVRRPVPAEQGPH